MTIQQVENIVQEAIDGGTLIQALLSSPRHSNSPQKITIRPILIKEQVVYQWTEQQGSQAIHSNMTEQELFLAIQKQVLNFKQIYLYTSLADYQVLIGKKGNITILKKNPSKTSLQPSTHNRKKEYLIEENQPVSFLVELGVMNASGKVHQQKRDKFKQINRFLEMVEDIFSYLPAKKTIRIVDFGCGKAYLTFALYHYLARMKQRNVEIVGIDLKEKVLDECRTLASKLDFKGLHFVTGDVHRYERSDEVDMVVSLHACDTATDAALAQAVKWQAGVILCAPCCQHELFNQVQSDPLQPLLKHGILKERFTALATDAVRAQLLEVMNYKVQVLEFIDVEHTPKNIMIRAVKQSKTNPSKEAWQGYLNLKSALHITPTMEKLLSISI